MLKLLDHHHITYQNENNKTVTKTHQLSDKILILGE